jgi:HEAT repeat protein
VRACLKDDSWRVREMALKVVARRCIDNALEAVALLQHDDIARVRAAAQRALMRLVQNEV